VTKKYDFSGVWRSSYNFTTNSPDAPFTDEYDVQIYPAGANRIVVQSQPNDKGSYILIRLTLDDRLLTGIWYEQTAPGGHYKGVTYYGPIQLVMDEDGNAMHGQWLGVDDHMNMQGGEQAIVRKQ
jgi:hypothetical protein